VNWQDAQQVNAQQVNWQLVNWQDARICAADVF
jgi:hypothetical protein